MTEEQLILIAKLSKHNDSTYNLHKAAEECQELGLVLTQFILKPQKVEMTEIIDEIGDVIIRLEILKRIFPIDKIEERVAFKLSKYKDYLELEKYDNI